MLSKMVAKEVQTRLPMTDLVTLPITLSSRCGVVCYQLPYPALTQGKVCSHSYMICWYRGNWRQERSGHVLGFAQAPHLIPPSMGKHSRQPKDVHQRIKRSCPGVGGNLAPTHPEFPSGFFVLVFWSIPHAPLKQTKGQASG